MTISFTQGGAQNVGDGIPSGTPGTPTPTFLDMNDTTGARGIFSGADDKKANNDTF